MAKATDDKRADATHPPTQYKIGARECYVSDREYGRTLIFKGGSPEIFELIKILDQDKSISSIEFRLTGDLSPDAKLALAQALGNSTSIIYAKNGRICHQYILPALFDIEMRDGIKANPNILSIADLKAGEAYSICPLKEQAAMALAEQLKATELDKISIDLAAKIIRSAGAVEFLLRTKLGLPKKTAEALVNSLIITLLPDALPSFSYGLVRIVRDYLIEPFPKPTHAEILTNDPYNTALLRAIDEKFWRAREEARSAANRDKTNTR